MLDLRDGGVGDHLLERQHTLQTVLIIDHVDVINIIQVFRLVAHLL